jgi:hypothetical protein
MFFHAGLVCIVEERSEKEKKGKERKIKGNKK